MYVNLIFTFTAYTIAPIPVGQKQKMVAIIAGTSQSFWCWTTITPAGATLNGKTNVW